ncbi:DUF1653 domain-containing protein [Asticcacaulis sp. 201]|uniref:DUF1653 domain-containing protein n=1 Tax=Asticcacaulis sp. 201 TaxID=3028787 RepID=UPI002916ED13|nr:DUF1653 domain-containing protein [Asticcacaulis sp. 201]MDV6330585.1 DUF1653 domain-containing protein [Asticcacaulis sp. 201]
MPLTTSFYRTGIKRGTYRHYKNKLYKVFGTVTHSESEEELVLYAPLGQEAGIARLWVRPLAMFTETVEVDGKTVPRFELIADVLDPTQ